MTRMAPSRLAAALCALAILALTAPASAQDRGRGSDEPDYGRFGFYMGGGVTYATDLYEDEIEDAFNTGFEVDVDDTWGANARIGVRLLSFFALELQYEWLDSYDIEVQNAGGGSEVDTQTLTANLKFYLPIQRFQPYLLAGVGYQRYELDSSFFNGTIRAKQDDYELAGRGGVGFDLYFTEHVVFYAEGFAVLSEAEIDIPLVADVDNLFYAGGQAGLLYRF